MKNQNTPKRGRKDLTDILTERHRGGKDRCMNKMGERDDNVKMKNEEKKRVLKKKGRGKED